jgi:ADP-ribosylglycohydrolase
MAEGAPDLLSRFRGAVIGQAVGDALGFPLEGLPPDITALATASRPLAFRRHAAGAFPLGQYTDDTQMMRAVLESIVERGDVDPADVATRFGELWATSAIVGQGTTCREAVLRVLSGVPWDQAGIGAPHAGNGSAMRTAPIGLLRWNDHEALVRDAETVSSITHRDPRCLAGSAAVSAAVAFNVSADAARFDGAAFLAAVTSAAAHASPEVAFAVERVPEWLGREPGRDVFDEIAVTGQRYDATGPAWKGISPFVIPTVVASVYAFLVDPTDFTNAVATAISAGGDVDTTAAIAGAISGALNGLEGVPELLARSVNDNGRFGYDYLVDLATRLHALG